MIRPGFGRTIWLDTRSQRRIAIAAFALGAATGYSCQPRTEPEPQGGVAVLGTAASVQLRQAEGGGSSATVRRRSNAVNPSASAAQGRPEWLAAAELTWRFRSAWGPLHVVVRLPRRTADQTFGALVALHGRGETLKGSARGARGWLDDYGVLGAIERLKQPPLEAADFGGFVTTAELARFNERLLREPYRDMVLLMPYVPDVLKRGRAFANGPKLAALLRDQVLPRALRELPIRQHRSFSIDGVSLGGRASLLVAFAAPELFVSAGGLQAAIDEKELPKWTSLAKAGTEANPLLKLRLLTSDEDYYQGVNRSLSQSWTRAGVPHVFRVVQGTHSYEFNRGPGALYMLAYHARYLTRNSP